MDRLTSIQTIEHTDGANHEQVYCFGHLWGPAFFKKGTKDYEEYLTIVKHLAEYETLEEQGKLLKLPVAVGDTVYYAENEYYFSVLAIKIDEIVISEPGTFLYRGLFFDGNGDVETQFDFDNDDFGKDVFLTREAAETTLKELNI